VRAIEVSMCIAKYSPSFFSFVAEAQYISFHFRKLKVLMGAFSWEVPFVDHHKAVT
jgi:hypothetical protein